MDERRELDDMMKEYSPQIVVLQRERRRNLDNELKLKRQMAVAKKKELDMYKAKRGKKGRVRFKLEKKLKENGIDRPVYHGGNLTGVKVKVLLQNINKIFGEEFKEIIMEVEDREVGNGEVNQMVDMYRDLGFMLDGVFSLGRIGCGKLAVEDVELTRGMVGGVMKLWRYLRLSMKGPKIHGLEDHLLEHMIRWNRIGDFLEDFVEQAHQYEVKEENRTRRLSRLQAFRSHLNWEWKSNQIGAIKAKKEMRRKTSRSPKQNTRNRLKNKKDTRVENRMKSLENGMECMQ
jgi:hypothetical protein